MIAVVFKTIPKIVKGSGTSEDLRGKEVVAHLMMRNDLASEIDRYKFKIDADIYRKLMFTKLREMKHPQYWLWKKQAKVKLDLYDKLFDLTKQYIAIDLCMSISELEKCRAIIKQQIESDNKYRKYVVDKIIENDDIQEVKKKDKLYKKYNVKQEQQSLF